MDEKAFELGKGLIKAEYLKQAKEARKQRTTMIHSLLAQRRIPDKGWEESLIEQFLFELSSMDSNNFLSNVGVGEREARVFSPLVLKRHFSMAHGIGRSGDLVSEQPKAAGSSIIYALTNKLALDALHICGISKAANCIVVPLATGMTLSLVLLALKTKRPSTATNVIWSRIDQKSCLKAIAACGLTPIPVEGKLGTDEVKTTIESISEAIEKCGGINNVLCIISTTSCFCPRSPDDVVGISKLCSNLSIPHIVNNAYGLQSSRTCHLIDESLSSTAGRRIDAFVQSTDKNFLVPVGGAIIASGNCDYSNDLIDAISKTYPGRASSSPIVDLFITLLQMGKQGLCELLQKRVDLMPYFIDSVAKIASKHNERMLLTPNNQISFGITLENHTSKDDGQRFVGSMLFNRNCSGTRVWTPFSSSSKTICGINFNGYGSHCSAYPRSYMSIACAIGITQHDIDVFCNRLDSVLSDYEKQKPTTSQSLLPPSTTSPSTTPQ